MRKNLAPVFCDIDPRDYTIAVSKIEDLITPRTVAVMPMHVYGNLCDAEAIQEIADRHGLKVLYDGAHAFGTTYKGVGVGNLAMFLRDRYRFDTLLLPMPVRHAVLKCAVEQK